MKLTGNAKLWWLLGLIFMVIVLGARYAVRMQATPRAASSTQVTVSSITLAVNPVENALSQQLNSTFNMPYTRLDRNRFDAGRVENRTFTLLILENDYLKVTILPELGGRIYQTIFKPTGNNMFYQNPILKPAPWGPTEMGWWWAAGGMEWCLPVEEHGYEWGIPWQYTIQQTAGGVTVELRDSAAANRLRAKVAVTLPNDAAYFEVTPTLENPTATPVDYKFWLNAMLAPGPANKISPNLRVIMPTDRVTVHSSGDSRLPGAWTPANWPVHNGVDWSLLGNWRQWYGFFQYPRAAGNFQAIYDEGYDEGVVRTYNSQQVQGAKFFAFGNGSTAISPDLYTNDGSSYVEIHGGVAPTFADTRRLEAGDQFSWTERWYPVAGIGSLTWANDQVALNLRSDGATAQLHVAATQIIPNVRVTLLRRATNQILFEADGFGLEPGQPYHSPQISLPNLSQSELAVAIFSDGTLIGAYQYSGGELVTPTPGAPPTWQGQLVRETAFNSWAGVLRVWVRNQVGLSVTLSNNSGWQVVNKAGTKPEYGVDALEFAPLAPGTYFISPEGLNARFELQLRPGTIAEVVFTQTGQPAAATPSPTPLPTATPTRLSTATPTLTPAPTATATPIATPTPATGGSGWQGRVAGTLPVSGWASVARIWVTGRPNLKVTLTALEWNWSGTNTTGSKAEYGPDALEFAPLAPGRYRVSVPGLPATFDVTLEARKITRIVFEPVSALATAIPTAALPPTATPTATATPSPTVTPFTATATPSPTAAALGWRARLVSNQRVSSNWFSVIRVSVDGKLNLPVRITSPTSSWNATCTTGSKPEFGPYYCEFAPIIPGTYTIAPTGLNISTGVTVSGGGVAVILFEKQ